MEKLKVNTEINFKAPAAKVWQGLTDPAMVKEYFFGTNLESSWKVGEPITFSGEWDGNKYQDKGTILDIDPGKFVKYSYWSSMGGTEDKPENYANITYSLAENDGETKLTITQDNVKNQEAKEHSEQNWKGVFEELRKLIE
ncbi:SRPBCC family protein [Mucilaginibacter sp.]|uniref:SRPBCC family protein n=1 Tax=Mucilaginibacter sp. TaxID=1882438 RepID=UPI0025EE27A1|nr:SRPBCC family protein [Mucilaginibacter sp.]